MKYHRNKKQTTANRVQNCDPAALLTAATAADELVVAASDTIAVTDLDPELDPEPEPVVVCAVPEDELLLDRSDEYCTLVDPFIEARE